MQKKFVPFEAAGNGINVNFKEGFVAANFPTLLVETYVRQDPQDQRLGLVVQEREPNEYIIKMHEIGFPRVTDGVHFAVRQLTDWLVGLHPDATISHHNLLRIN